MQCATSLGRCNFFCLYMLFYLRYEQNIVIDHFIHGQSCRTGAQYIFRKLIERVYWKSFRRIL